MLKRIKRFGLPIIFGTALSLIGPSAALARDHDRDRDRDGDRREWREHERHEWREHEWRERGPRFRGSFYFGPSYTYRSSNGYNGYYDRWGYWHPYASGYYDRWGNWHPYGY